MKNVLFFIALAMCVFTSCYNKSKQRAMGWHDGQAYAPGSGQLFKMEEMPGTGTKPTKGDTIIEMISTENYELIVDNPFLETTLEPLSTFSIDVDNASYSNMRRFVEGGQSPPKDAVRIEEFINYFDYDYPAPSGETPFTVNTELASCPWNTAHQLVMIGLQGKDIDLQKMDPSNLVFLVDVSGSMASNNKLPLVKESLIAMVNALGEADKVALVTYAGEAGVVLEPTSCSDKSKIIDAIKKLGAEGSTHGSAGIEKAYDLAIQHQIANGNNRVILCTDGDFNVGVSSEGELVRLIEEKRKSGVFLTVCGFGMGNYQDSKVEQLADHGNGVCYYIDGKKEAEHVFVKGRRSTLFTIAKDVKIQVEFNPLYVGSYRLIGYENRVLHNQDFANDSIDAGDIGAGLVVTALYEIVPAYGQAQSTQLKYQVTKPSEFAYQSGDVMNVALRYKQPQGDTSILLNTTVNRSQLKTDLSDNMKWACSVASFGMILRDSPYKGSSNHELVLALSGGVSPSFMDEYKTEFRELVRKTEKLVVAKK